MDYQYVWKNQKFLGSKPKTHFSALMLYQALCSESALVPTRSHRPLLFLRNGIFFLKKIDIS